MSTDTPRTDLCLSAHEVFIGGAVPVEFARDLERENARLREDKARLDWLEFPAGRKAQSQYPEVLVTRAVIDEAMEEK